MHLKTDDENMDESATVKLQIPKRQHLRLHCLKILTGQTMSDIATEALERHFEATDVDDEVAL